MLCSVAVTRKLRNIGGIKHEDRFDLGTKCEP